MGIGWIGKNPRRLWVASGLILYAGSLFIFFVIWTFPYRLLSRHVVKEIEWALSCPLQVEKEDFVFPLGVRWEEVSVCLNRPSFFRIEQIQAKARLFPFLLSRRGEVDWSMEALGGQASGHVRIVRRGRGLHFRLQGGRADFDLARVDKGLNGSVRIEVEGEWEEDSGMGSGRATVAAEKVVIRHIDGVLLPISPIRFASVEGRVVLTERRLSLERIQAQGDQVDISGAGNILLRDPYPSSLLSLAFRLHPKGELAQMAELFYGSRGGEPLPVSITHTLGVPKVQVNGIAVN